MKIIKNYAPTTKTYKGKNPNTTCTIHETANTARGADAVAHGNLQKRGFPGTDSSWHETVDDKQAVVSFKDEVQCWHAGTRRGSETSYSIEICVNRDGDYDKAVANAAQRAADWMGRHGHTDASKVLVQHNHWSGKNCPSKMRAQRRWSAFVEQVQALVDGTKPSPKPTPKPSPTPKVDVTKMQTVRAGQKGIYVGIMQGALISRGYSVGRFGLDKSNGPDTQAALRRFQTRHPETGTNGKPDGSCGPKTWKKLLGA